MSSPRAYLIGLLIVALGFSVTACSGSIQPGTVDTVPATASPEPNATSGNPVGELFDSVTELPEGESVAGAAAAPTSAPLLAISETNLVAPAQELNYWAEDWCHYYQGNDGVIYGEACVRAEAYSDGTIIPNQYLMYRFDNTRPGNIGDAFFELYTANPAWTIYRDLTDPIFNQVAWVAFPTNAAQITADNYLAGLNDGNGGMVWYSLAQIQAMVAQAQPQAPSVPSNLNVPAWDPAITVVANLTQMQIRNTMRQIPSIF